VRRTLVALAACLLALTACSADDAAPTPAGIAELRTSVPTPAPPTREPDPLRYVALGDGYVAGTGTITPRRDSWPAQLAQAMAGGEVRLELVDNLAENGQTSQDVLRVQLPQVAALAPDVVSLQVGVNDIIARDISLADYRANMARIMDALLELLPSGRIFIVTTPDHTLTERGGDFGPREAARADVAASNAIVSELAAERGLAVIDIAPVNERAAGDPSLVVGTGPYPSAKQYAGWVEVIGPRMRRVLLGEEP
jgi:lysophospholipase L1-like esterase